MTALGDHVSFSVALATYNGEAHLDEQLASIAAQTHRPAEMVVSDDGSTDGTLSVLRRFARTAPFPVHVYSNERTLGYRDNFLRAARLTSFPWIAFSDQDDVWLKGKLEAVRRAIGETPGVSLVTHSADLVDADLNPSGYRLPNYRRARVRGPLENWPIQVLTGFTLVFDRGLLDGVPAEGRPRDLNDPSHQLAHDQLVPFLANVFGRTAYLSETLALYRRHESAATGEAGTGAYRTGLRADAAAHLRTMAQDYLRQADIVEEHAEFLEVLASVMRPDKATLAKRGAAHYRDYAGALAVRASVYDKARPRLQRVLAWSALVRAGAYRRLGPGTGLGWKACAKDVALGFLQ